MVRAVLYRTLLGPGSSLRVRSILTAVLGLFAYRMLFVGMLRVPESSEFERWFFLPEQRSPLLPLGIAVWMFWYRRTRLRALRGESAPVLAAACVALGIGAFVWAGLAGESSLLLLSLAANLLGFAAASRGRAGFRAVLLPALVLLLGIPIPAPLRDAFVWWLQVSSAHGATWLLETAGVDIALGGVQIHRGNYAFTVIETCAGLRGIEILTLIALAIRELFVTSGWRSWIVVSIAPGLGFLLNVVRIAAVVVLTRSEGSELESWDHTPQGIAVLLAGVALLYALGRWAGGPARSDNSVDGRGADQARGNSSAPRHAAVGGAPIVLAVLALVSVSLAPLARPTLPPPIELPLWQAGWSGEDLALDRSFVGQFQPGQVLHRRYHRDRGGRAPWVADLLVGYEVVENPASRLLSPKLLVPAHDWTLVERRPVRLWLLGRDAEAAIAARGSELVLGYVWRLRDEGIASETWRAALALDVGPLRRERRRAVVRLETPLAHTGPAARDRAKQTLDRFIADFLDELAGL